MFSRISRPIISSANTRLSYAVRGASKYRFSAISIRSSFPASLIRLNAGVVFKQFSFERQALSECHGAHDEVGILKDNLDNAADWSNLPCMLSRTLVYVANRWSSSGWSNAYAKHIFDARDHPDGC